MISNALKSDYIFLIEKNSYSAYISPSWTSTGKEKPRRSLASMLPPSKISAPGSRFPRVPQQGVYRRCLQRAVLVDLPSSMLPRKQRTLSAGSSVGTALTRPTIKTCCFSRWSRLPSATIHDNLR